MFKIKNHQEGFQDSILHADTAPLISSLESDAEADILRSPALLSIPQAPVLSYQIQASGTSYSGSILAESFVIVPLFADPGVYTQTRAKSPYSPSPLESLPATQGFRLDIASGTSLAWNTVGMSSGGVARGIVGTGAL
jgi:hypothetical protein